jgi:L-ribulokinase
MQVVADVLNRPIKVARSEQACALGSAMAAAMASGIYSSAAEAQARMGSGIETEYHPIPENVRKYETLYEEYKKFGNYIEYGCPQ